MMHYLPHAVAVVFFLLFLRERGKAKEHRATVEELAETLRERVLQAYELVRTCEGLAQKLRSTAATASAALRRSTVFEDLAEKRGALVGGLMLQQEIVTRLLQEGEAAQALEVLQADDENRPRPWVEEDDGA